MKVTGIILDDGKGAGPYFGFLKQFPSVCAQADTIDGVSDKLDAYLKIHLKRLADNGIESDSIRIAV